MTRCGGTPGKPKLIVVIQPDAEHEKRFPDHLQTSTTWSTICAGCPDCSPCPLCMGSGEIEDDNIDNPDPPETCPDCKGPSHV